MVNLEKNVVEQRPVTVGSLQSNGLRVITQGLKASDWVVISSPQLIRQGLEVQPEKWTMPSLGSPPQRITDDSSQPAVKGEKKKKG